MTQLMLFDSCSLATAANAASPVAASPVSASPVASPASSRPRGLPQPRPSIATGEDGVHRMGDLARLVLLRYELVAQRRHEMAARRAK